MPTSVPASGTMVPNFSLASSGGEVQISDFRGRRNLALFFVGCGGSGMDALLAALAQRRAELDEEETAVLIVSTGAADRPYPFLVLHDSDGAVHRRFGASENAPAVYLTDRYGEIYSTCRTADGEPLPGADEILASLRHINIACPE